MRIFTRIHKTPREVIYPLYPTLPDLARRSLQQHDRARFRLSGKVSSESETKKRKLPYNPPRKLTSALKIYHEIYNKTEVPPFFKIVDDEAESWPKAYHGYNLGLSLQRSSTKMNSTAITIQLNDTHDTPLKFTTRRKNKWDFTGLTGAIVIYRSMNNGSLVVPRNWTVPSSEPWPKNCWGVKLGEALTAVRSRADTYSSDIIAALDAAGFVWDPYAYTVESLIEALKAYSSINGNLDVPRQYIIPCEEPFREVSSDDTN